MVTLPRLTLSQLDPRASAAALQAPLDDAVLPITGTTTITSITAAGRGQILVLEFASAACQVTNGSNLKLRQNYISTASGTLTLICDGTNWIEVARAPLNLVAADFPAFTTWAPTGVFQNVSPAFTVNYARTVQFGKFAMISAVLAITGAGTAGIAISVGLPAGLTLAAGQSVLGSFVYNDVSVAIYAGAAMFNTGTNVQFIVSGNTNFLGVTPNFATANGDTLSFDLLVELA